MTDEAAVDIREFISAHTLLSQLEAEELERLMTFSIRRSYAKNEIIFRKGDPGYSMMILVRGRVKISSIFPEGKEVVLAVLEKGEILGEMALLEGKERSADATALQPSELLELQKRDFIPFLERNPKICIRMLSILSARLRQTSDHIQDRNTLSLPCRLAKALLELSQTHGREVPEGVRVDMIMSQKNFGAMLGASRESINKQLGAWRREGLIKKGRGFIILTRPAELSCIVDV